MRRARRRDRRVYLYRHPVLFALLAATRHRPAIRLGGSVLAHSRGAYLDALTRVPLDRTAEGTTGGAAGRLTGGGLLFDQQGDAHRGSRRTLADPLGAAGVERLRPVWTAVLTSRLAPLAAGGRADLVDVAAELAGATAAALLGLDVDAGELAAAARAAAAAGAREHLPGVPWPGRHRAAREATERLTALLTSGNRPAARTTDPGAHLTGGAHLTDGHVGEVSGAGGADRAAENSAAMAAILAVAAINTTVAALPRAAAWCADAGLWPHAAGPGAEVLAAELLRVTAPTPLLPRVAAAAGTVGGRPVRPGDRLLLITRHAVDAHRRDPSPTDPASPQVAQLVFGAGPHACPGARLAREQLSDALHARAPHRPVVVSARVDRRSALPGWSSLVMTAGS